MRPARLKVVWSCDPICRPLIGQCKKQCFHDTSVKYLHEVSKPHESQNLSGTSERFLLQAQLLPSAVRSDTWRLVATTGVMETRLLLPLRHSSTLHMIYPGGETEQDLLSPARGDDKGSLSPSTYGGAVMEECRCGFYEFSKRRRPLLLLLQSVFVYLRPGILLISREFPDFAGCFFSSASCVFFFSQG